MAEAHTVCKQQVAGNVAHHTLRYMHEIKSKQEQARTKRSSCFKRTLS